MNLIVFVSMLAAASASAWSPPPDPDPNAILQSAQSVARRVAFVNPFLNTSASEEEKADATAQFVWFYENALAIDSALSGVRQSFALQAWAQLGDAYAPAREQLIATRELRVQRVHAGTADRNAFWDAASINQYLKDDNNTVQLFSWLDQNNPALAKKVYTIAQPALIVSRNFTLCIKYLDPDKELERAVRSYDVMKKMPEPENTALLRMILPDSSRSSFAEKDFSSRMTTIVALLAMSGDHDRAADVSRRALAVDNSPQLQTSMKDALKGIVPAPWPPRD